MTFQKRTRHNHQSSYEAQKGKSVCHQLKLLKAIQTPTKTPSQRTKRTETYTDIKQQEAGGHSERDLA